jgi:hypothetical protein
MATKCLTLESGAKVKYYFQPLRKGDCSKPPDIVITTSALAAADGNAASITVTALPAGTNLPEGMWLDFENPTTGAIVPVQLAAAAIAAGTSLSVANIPAAIASGSTCQLPALLTARESGSIDRSGNSEDVDLLDNFWAYSETVGANWGSASDGAYSQLASSYRNVEYVFKNGGKGWFRAEFPSPDPLLYSTGAVYEGEVSIEGIPLDMPKGVVKANITFKGNGELYKIEPKVVAAVVP